MVSYKLERKMFSSGYHLIVGLDEAGRGTLAGPVVAACVGCSAKFDFADPKFKNLRDSKKIVSKKREELYNNIINDNFLQVTVGVCDHSIIDKINILRATLLAMRRAVVRLSQKPDCLLIDGKNIIPNFNIKQRAIIKGDNKVFLIAAASVVAKVTRDRMMKKLHRQYPEYNFSQHKGYGTKEHIDLIQRHGPCLIHRRTFSPVRNFVNRTSTCEKALNKL